jgi:hypothetical protein
VEKAKSEHDGKDFRAVKEAARTEARLQLADAERRAPALTSQLQAATQALEAYIHRDGARRGGVMNAPPDTERDRLMTERQAAYDEQQRNERIVEASTGQLKTLDRLLDAPAEVQRLTDVYGRDYAAAHGTARKLAAAGEMVASGEEELAERNRARAMRADQEADRAAEHAAAVVEARLAGKPEPASPAKKTPDDTVQSDAQLLLELDAAKRMRTRLAEELRALVEALTDTRSHLMHARHAAAEADFLQAMHVAGPAIAEFEASRRAIGLRGQPPAITLDDIAVRTRVLELETEVPVWRAAQRTNDALQDGHGDADPPNAFSRRALAG